MKAYVATYATVGKAIEETTKMVGAQTLAGAARKAENAVDETQELIKVELTSDTIL